MHLLMTSELGIPDLKSIPIVRPRARCFPALNHIWGKQAPPRHREAVIFPHCPREEIRSGLSRGLSRTRMARRAFVQHGQAE